ncbi:hypothetical protein CLPUN_04630 [Clostridium puniceum]|uniref:Lipoprotein n=1 Tax=Clostridium puniceum TaxID=29367 RepID=A0A1S8TWS4_9CLOT|nr:DUF4883 family protein [Clostridium puniceum]OOM82161.1 hypothetical protein CLPUN_04630 [Clostridium puniceum]
MKKFNLIFITLLLLFSLSGCITENPQYINFSTKPNNHYYTDQLKNKILGDENFTLYVFDTNLYKEIEVSKNENPIIKNFISSLISDSYSDEQINKKESFRIKVVFNDDKYLIKIFDNSIASISPWDGNYKEDIISVKELPLRYNLLDFCNHIANKPLSS